MWCIGAITEEYRTRMYDILDTYAKSLNTNEPIICVDEKSLQLLKETRTPLAGLIKKIDYEYERNGVANIFVAVEPLAGRYMTQRRTKADFTHFIRTLLDTEYKDAKLIHLVLDNLNTHFPKSFEETFGKREAKRILKRIVWHYTPKHASWLDMAEIAINMLSRECLKRRIPTIEKLTEEVAAWTEQQTKDKRTINWTFTKQKADEKLGKHYISNSKC